MAFTSVTIVDTIHAEQPAVLREIERGYYTLTEYLASRLVLDALLLRTLPALVLCIPMYFLIGLQVNSLAFR